MIVNVLTVCATVRNVCKVVNLAVELSKKFNN